MCCFYRKILLTKTVITKQLLFITLYRISIKNYANTTQTILIVNCLFSEILFCFSYFVIVHVN